MYDFDGKKALIVGATGGMGAALAYMLSKNGTHCAFVGRDKQKLEDTFSVCSSFLSVQQYHYLSIYFCIDHFDISCVSTFVLQSF